jgi:hypothetical protein
MDIIFTGRGRRGNCGGEGFALDSLFMNAVAKLILAATALLLSAGLAAQTFKCTNADGKITYSGTKCSDLGLKDAGEVKNRLNVNPAYRPPATEGRRPVSPPPAATPESRNTGAPAPAEEAANPAAPPDRRCFTVSTAKGNVTRCNDRPSE